MQGALRFACLAAVVSCVIVPASSPTPPRGPNPSPQAQGQTLAVATTGPAAQPCTIDQKTITLGADRLLRCRGIPFGVEFPTTNVAQEKVGPGTSFLVNLDPGIVILGVRPATFEPLVFKDPQAGLDHSLDLIMGLLAQWHPRIERRYDVQLPGAIHGRGLEFSYPLGNKVVAGTVRAFLARGWIGIVLAGGPNDSKVHRGTEQANRFLDSLRVMPVDQGPYQATLEDGAHVTLPAEAWLNSDDRGKTAGIVRERTFALPDRDALFMLQEQQLGSRRCADVVDQQSSRAFLEEHLRSTAEVQFKTLQRVTIAGSTALTVEAGIRTSEDATSNAPHYPAVAVLFCKEPTYVLAIALGNRAHSELRKALEGILGTYDR